MAQVPPSSQRIGGSGNQFVPLSTSNAAFAGVANGRLLSPTGDGLNLMNGMTAGYGVNDGHIDNPAAYPGQYGGNPKWAPQRVGVLRNVPGYFPSGRQYSLYFIYNPNQINVSFNMNFGQTPPNYAGPGSPGNSPVVVNTLSSQQVSWSLLFDRTKDMLYSKNAEVNRGVLRDVAALYNVLGTFETPGAVPTTGPIEVVFGRSESGQLWGFTGFITAANITYGTFRYNMFPSNCQVDLVMTEVYVAPQTGGNNNNNNTLNASNNGTTSIDQILHQYKAPKKSVAPPIKVGPIQNPAQAA